MYFFLFEKKEHSPDLDHFSCVAVTFMLKCYSIRGSGEPGDCE